MAIYHLKAATGTRSGGQSAAAKHDYIQREGKYARDPAEVVHAEDGNMPAWAEGRARQYWEAADAHERANGRLYREVEFALPAELDPAQRVAAAQAFARQLCGGERLPYSLAIHRGAAKEAGEPDNPHCHLMLSERINDGIAREAGQWFRRWNGKAPERGGARKSVASRPRAWLEDTRAAWADLANERLARAGSAARIDERSLHDQLIGAIDDSNPEDWDQERRNPHTGERGYWTPEYEARLEQLDREPGRHRGPVASAVQRKLKKQGRETDRAVQLRAAALWDQTRARLAVLAERLAEIGQGLAAQLDRALENARATDRRRPVPAPARPSLEEQARDVTRPKGPEFDFGR